jgi:hypothetical protein
MLLVPKKIWLPHVYQLEACTFLATRERANLFAEIGTGKTMVALERVRQKDWSNVLVVAPKAVCEGVWQVEPRKWHGFEALEAGLLYGAGAVKPLRSIPRVCAIHPQLLPRLIADCGDQWPFRHVIWDESTRLAGYRTRQGTVRARHMAEVAFTKVSTWLNLSGAPNANGYRQFWGPQWFIDGGEALGRDYKSFIKRWFMLDPYGGTYAQPTLQPGAREAIDERLRPSTFAVRAQDHMTLEPVVERTVTFELPYQARSVYNSMKRDLQAQAERGEIKAFNAGVKAGKLRQIASGAVYHEDHSWSVVHEERLELIRSLIEELAGAPLLIVYQYKHEMAQLKMRFKMARERRENGAVAAWNRGEVPILLLQPSSAGHGLSLQDGGHHLCFYSPLSDNELYTQVLGRLGPARQAQSGYKRSLHVHHLEAAGSIDQHTRAVRQGRATDLDYFMRKMSVTA